MKKFIEVIIEESRGAEDYSQQEHILREAVQRVFLQSLADAGFFKEGVFHGGTALRIFRGSDRYSEDLDFCLKKSNLNFSWSRYAQAIQKEANRMGLSLTVKEKDAEGAVKKVVLRESAISQSVDLKFRMRPGQNIAVKLEVDCNPPAGGKTELVMGRFPSEHSVLIQDLSTGFAGKLHACLCREYDKGRDWYDFQWYVDKKASPNLLFLQHAMEQQGPWADQNVHITNEWLVKQLRARAGTVDWVKAKEELKRFLLDEQRDSLDRFWGKNSILASIDVLERNLVKQNELGPGAFARTMLTKYEDLEHGEFFQRKDNKFYHRTFRANILEKEEPFVHSSHLAAVVKAFEDRSLPDSFVQRLALEWADDSARRFEKKKRPGALGQEARGGLKIVKEILAGKHSSKEQTQSVSKASHTLRAGLKKALARLKTPGVNFQEQVKTISALKALSQALEAGSRHAWQRSAINSAVNLNGKKMREHMQKLVVEFQEQQNR